jgi:methylmalonyl-CoA mutase N-terminal domain/subunit
LLIDENRVGNTVDPLGGSYYVETLTNQIEEEAWGWYKRVEAMGKAAATERGFYIREMADGMYRYQQNIESGKTVVIGVNKFCLDNEPSIKIFRPDPAAAKNQMERLNSIRARRNNTAVDHCLAQIRRIAEAKKSGKDENIVPYFVEAVKAYASIGELFNVLRQVFGEYTPLNII